MKYTTFCRESNDQGTTHITCVEAESPKQAMELGLAQCCEDWNTGFYNYSEKNVTCVGVAEGDVNILHWEDLSE